MLLGSSYCTSGYPDGRASTALTAFYCRERRLHALLHPLNHDLSCRRATIASACACRSALREASADRSSPEMLGPPLVAASVRRTALRSNGRSPGQAFSLAATRPGSRLARARRNAAMWLGAGGRAAGPTLQRSARALQSAAKALLHLAPEQRLWHRVLCPSQLVEHA